MAKKQSSKSRGRSNVPARRQSTLPAANLVKEMAQDGNKGMENMGADDVAIPFLTILQAMSPQVKKGPQKIKGAEEGDIFNTVTNEVYSGEEGIMVIPCFYQKAYVEWIPRDQGGGFVRQHSDPKILDKCIRGDDNRDILKENGHNIVTTGYHFVLLMKPDGSVERCVISMSSTQLKKSRRWNSQMMSLQVDGGGGRKVTPPMFSHVYKIKTVGEQNDQGSWYGWIINVDSMVDSVELYSTAKEFHGSIASGAVRMAPPPRDDNSSDIDGVM